MDVQHVHAFRVVRGLFEMNEVELKDYFGEMLDERTKQLTDQTENVRREMLQEFKAIALALKKAEDRLDHKFEEVNKVRDQIDNERNLLAKREYVDTNLNAIRDSIRKLENFKFYLVGYTAGVVGIVAVITYLFTTFWK